MGVWGALYAKYKKKGLERWDSMKVTADESAGYEGEGQVEGEVMSRKNHIVKKG